ncbi:MAG: NADH-quinone oxidoreductase subunit G [Sphingosinicella sp.]|nr:NADH-quinone oxidoreductase subunit G [Sphingosinicella sp.]
MPKLTVDGIEVEVPAGATVLQACEAVGKEVPRFCYHERLSIAGNCRMCLVEVKPGPPKPQASCALPAADGQEVRTDSAMVKKAREGVMEFLLINHPLDCPICDQGGECDLQDQSIAYGRGATRYTENKRAVTEKYMGPIIKTVMTRCIHCTRCVRFAEEVAGTDEIGALYRGENMQITSYLEAAVKSELSGNVIDLCPVGALTSKPYAFEARPWELTKTNGICVMDAVGTNIRIDARGPAVLRVLPRVNDDVNEEWASDKTRYAPLGLAKRRLDKPYVRRGGKLEAASWAEAFAAIKTGLSDLSGNQIGAVAGELLDVESMVALKDLMKSLGSDRFECRTDGAVLPGGGAAGYRFNTGIAGIEDADVVLLVGADPRWDAPLVNTRLRKAVVKKGAKVFNVGPEIDLTYPVTQLGDGASVLGKLPKAAADALKSATKPAIIVGAAALTRGDAPAILAALGKIAKTAKIGADGFNVLHTAASRVGGLDIGFTHEGGIGEVLGGGLKALIVHGADEIDTDLDGVFKVYIGHHGDAGARGADVILPAASFAEKDGTYVNMEGRVQRSYRAVFAPGDAREDWAILRALSEVLGSKLPYDSFAALRARIAAEWPQLAEEGVAAAEGEIDFGSGGEFDAAPIGRSIRDFYLTNAIARASEVMQDCSATLVRGETVLEAAE